MSDSLLRLYAKALRFSPATSDAQTKLLPNIQRGKYISIDPAHCTSYNDLVSWAPKDPIIAHPNYAQMLSLPMQLDMMVDQEFPFKPMGLVHLANQICVNMLPKQDQYLFLSTEFGKVFKHKKGYLFEVITTASLAEPSKLNKNQIDKSATFHQHSQNLQLKATSYYLARSPSKKESGEAKIRESSANIPVWINSLLKEAQTSNIGLHGNRSVKFDSNVGRKYAKISGDYNPIHLHSLTAKMLGFKRAIAHGMYSKAVLLSNLRDKTDFCGSPFIVNTVFMQPVVLPLETYFSSRELSLQNKIDKDASYSFHLSSKARRKNRVHVLGTLGSFSDTMKGAI